MHYVIEIFLDILERSKTAAYENTIYQLSELDPSGRMATVSDSEGLLEYEGCPFHLQTIATTCMKKGYYLILSFIDIKTESINFHFKQHY